MNEAAAETPTEPPRKRPRGTTTSEESSTRNASTGLYTCPCGQSFPQSQFKASHCKYCEVYAATKSKVNSPSDATLPVSPTLHKKTSHATSLTKSQKKKKRTTASPMRPTPIHTSISSPRVQPHGAVIGSPVLNGARSPVPAQFEQPSSDTAHVAPFTSNEPNENVAAARARPMMHVAITPTREATHAVLRHARPQRHEVLERLEADNYIEKDDKTSASLLDDTQEVEEEDESFMSLKKKRKRVSRGNGQQQQPGSQKKNWLAKRKKSFMVLLEEANLEAYRKDVPTYLTACAAPSKLPRRHFCVICGYWGTYTCTLCGLRFHVSCCSY